MQLIAEKLGKSDKLDRLRYVRADGSETGCPMPRQGILPHDLVHYVVESRLTGFTGFTSLVAAGAQASFAMEQTHALPGAKAKPNEQAAEQATEQAIQIEAIVEALQTQLWSGAFSEEDFAEGVRTAYTARDCPPCVVPDGAWMYEAALALNARWAALPFHASLTLPFPSA